MLPTTTLIVRICFTLTRTPSKETVDRRRAHTILRRYLPWPTNTVVDHRKKVYAIYWAIQRLDDLIGGVAFTIRMHRDPLFMNNHGSRKVLQWKLDIQH